MRRRRNEDQVVKVSLSAASQRLSLAGFALRGPADSHQEAETPERGRAGAEAAEAGGGGGQESQTPGGGQEAAAGAETQEEVRLLFFSQPDVGPSPLTPSALFGCRMEWWQSSGYRSLCLPPMDSGGEDEEQDEEEEEDDEDGGSMCSGDSASTDINYVLGDVTHPHMAASDAIVVHCVGRRRVFDESEEELSEFLSNL